MVNHTYINAKEHIYNLKWKTKDDLIANIYHTNKTIRTDKYNLLNAISELFKYNIY